MHNILSAAVRLRSEAVVWRDCRMYVLLYDEKSLPAEKFIFKLRRNLQACNLDRNELVNGYFSMILTTL